MGRSKDVISMTPSFREAHRSMIRRAPQFMHCPAGHELPHRTTWGRCSPLECIDKGDRGTVPLTEHDHGHIQEDAPYRTEMRTKPIGLERKVLTQRAHKVDSPEDADRVEAQAEEALALARAMGRNAARDALMEVPDTPPMRP